MGYVTPSTLWTSRHTLVLAGGRTPALLPGKGDGHWGVPGREAMGLVQLADGCMTLGGGGKLHKGTDCPCTGGIGHHVDVRDLSKSVPSLLVDPLKPSFDTLLL